MMLESFERGVWDLVSIGRFFLFLFGELGGIELVIFYSELSRFIARPRLQATIDKVNAIVETTRSTTPSSNRTMFC